MSLSIMQWLSMCGIVAAVLLFATELNRWRRLPDVINRRQKILRVILMVLIIVLLSMMFFGKYFSKYKDPVSEIFYWMGCIMLVLAILVVAMLDLREVARSFAVLKHKMFDDLRNSDRRDK